MPELISEQLSEHEIIFLTDLYEVNDELRSKLALQPEYTQEISLSADQLENVLMKHQQVLKEIIKDYYDMQ